MGQGEVLGDELAEEHRENVDERGGHECRDPGRQAPREADRSEHVLQQLSQRALRRVAEQDRGQRDAHLGARQLSGESAGGSQDGCGAAVALLRLLLEDSLVDRNEGKLGGNKDEGADGQDDAKYKHERCDHRASPSTRQGRVAGRHAGKG